MVSEPDITVFQREQYLQAVASKKRNQTRRNEQYQTGFIAGQHQAFERKHQPSN